MRSLRWGSIGSMRAWLPSRRSTAHQRGAVSMRLLGQVRSGRSTVICSWKGRYLCTGMPEGCWGLASGLYLVVVLIVVVLRLVRVPRPAHQPPRRGSASEGLAAATKEQHVLRGRAHGRAEERRVGKVRRRREAPEHWRKALCGGA